MKKILITGINGMLGQALLKEYSCRYDCYGISKSGEETEKIKIFNLIDKEILANTIAEIQPDYIIHCAAMIDVNKCETKQKEAYENNIKTTANLSEICKEKKIKIIYISTNMVFSGDRETAYNEKDQPCTGNVYGLTKYFCEIDIGMSVFDYLIVRTNIYGDKSFGKWLYDSLKNDKNIEMYDNIRFNCLTVSEMAIYLEKLFDERGIYHLTSRDSMSKYEFGNLMKEKMKSKSKIDMICYDNKIAKVKRPLNAVLDCSKYEKEVCKLPTMEESMNKYLDNKKNVC